MIGYDDDIDDNDNGDTERIVMLMPMMILKAMSDDLESRDEW